MYLIAVKEDFCIPQLYCPPSHQYVQCRMRRREVCQMRRDRFNVGQRGILCDDALSMSMVVADRYRGHLPG